VGDVIVLAAAGPGETNGVGDYAWRLTQAFRHDRPASLVVGRPPAGETARVDAEPGGIERLASWRELDAPAWRGRGASADAIHLQYFPQGFVAPDFPALARWLADVRRAGTPVVTALHEYWPHRSWSPVREAMRWRSRRVLREVAALSSALVASQPYSAGELAASGIVPPSKLHVIPISSNIPRVHAASDAAAVAHGPSLAIFGQPAMMIPAAVRAIAAWLAGLPAPPELRWFSRSASEQRAWWQAHVGAPPSFVAFHGGLPAADLSRHLQQATLGLALYDDGASTRRSSLAAMLEHELPIVGFDGRNTDERIRSSGAFALVAPDRPDLLPSTIAAVLGDRAKQAAMRAAAKRLFDRDLAWPNIAGAFRALERRA
jgi:glycosyltransferase involved in cell wall biosynthesis